MSYKSSKRIIDLIISLIGIIILLPILFIIAILIKLESKGPVIFKQERLGVNGKIFKIYKFRSMYLDAEKKGVYESKNDSRVTKVGKFIRKTSIDELPQFINIIKGEMSIIGPRPTLTYHPWSVNEYNSIQVRRFDVRPGVTGWAQVNGRKEISWKKRIEYDIEYVDNLSLKFDLKIAFRTIHKVLTMQNNINVNETVKKKVEFDHQYEAAATSEETERD